MPKIKTRKALIKRIKITKKGKVKKAKAFKGHLLTRKSRKRKRHLKQKNTVPSVEAKKFRKMAPYSR